MVTGMGNQRGDCGDDEKWSRSGNASRGASRCAAGCDWGCERMRGVQHLWPETWKDGAALAETRETLRVVG